MQLSDIKVGQAVHITRHPDPRLVLAIGKYVEHPDNRPRVGASGVEEPHSVTWKGLTLTPVNWYAHAYNSTMRKAVLLAVGPSGKAGVVEVVSAASISEVMTDREIAAWLTNVVTSTTVAEAKGSVKDRRNEFAQAQRDVIAALANIPDEDMTSRFSHTPAFTVLFKMGEPLIENMLLLWMKWHASRGQQINGHDPAALAEQWVDATKGLRAIDADGGQEHVDQAKESGVVTVDSPRFQQPLAIDGWPVNE